jgi:divalent metal cation (Fe/Co/Zn/Cd) transporter
MPIPLLERSPKETSQTIKSAIEELSEVKGVRNVSVRMTGKRLDITARVLLDNTLRFEDIHRIVSSIERQVRSKVQRIARITVQTEPVGHARTGLASLVSEIAENVAGSRGVHNVYIQRINGKICVDLRLEVGANITVKQAHEISKEVERRLIAANPHVSEVTIHLESASDLVSRELEGHGAELRWYIEHTAMKFPEIKAVNGVKIRRGGNTMRAVLRCHFDPNMSVKQAHDISLKLEKTVKSAYPILDDLEVLQEPA